MARATEFGIIPVFRSRDGQLAVQPQMMFPSEDDARRAAEIFAEVLGGAVAFSRIADREAGVAEDGVIIGKYGVMAEGPDEESSTQTRERSQGHPHGFPPLPLRNNPERYILTFFEAQQRLCALARLSRREMSTALAHGWGGGDDIDFRSSAAFGDSDDPGRQPSPPSGGELLARQARRIHELDDACPDAQWFVKMTGAWAFALAGTNAEMAWNGALACAMHVGEREFFDRVLAPWITHRFRHGGPVLVRPELADLAVDETEFLDFLPAVGDRRRIAISTV